MSEVIEESEDYDNDQALADLANLARGNLAHGAACAVINDDGIFVEAKAEMKFSRATPTRQTRTKLVPKSLSKPNSRIQSNQVSAREPSQNHTVHKLLE